VKEFGLRFAEVPNVIVAQPPPAPEVAETIDLRRLMGAARRQRRVFLVWVIAALGLGAAYLATTPPTYFAGTTVLVGDEARRAIDEMSAQDSSAMTETALESAQEVIRSQQIALVVAEQLQLHRQPAFLDPPVSGAARLGGAVRAIIRAPIRLLRPAVPAAPAAPSADTIARNAAVRSLQEGIDVTRIGRSSVFSIGFAAHDPVIAAEIANAYAEAYVADILKANFEATEQTTEWLQVRLDELQASAQQAAMDAERFRTENGLVASRGALVTEENVGQLNTDLAEAVTELARARALMETYDAALKDGPEGLIGDSGLKVSLPGDARLQLLQEALSSLIGRLAEVERDFGPEHEQARILRNQIAQQSQTLFAEMGRLAEAARGEFRVADARVAALRDSLGLAMDTNSAASEAQVQLRALEQRAQTLSVLYQTFLSRFQEMDQQKTFPISNVRILSVAEIPLSPYGPSTARVMALMLVLGLLAGFVTAAFREWRDRFLRTGDDVQVETGQRFLGYLPQIAEGAEAAEGTGGAADGTPRRGWFQRAMARRPAQDAGALQFRHKRGAAAPDPAQDRGRARQAAVRNMTHVAQSPRSLFAETLRNIRFASDVTCADAPSRVIGITSVRPGDGKSTVAANLATLMAAPDGPVLLVDADPRNPGLSRRLHLTAYPGLVEAVMGKAPWRSLIRVQPETGVHLLPCEMPKLMSYSSELLGSAGMRALLAELRTVFPTIILDMAPLGPVVDARVLAPLADQIVLVAGWGTTPRQLLRRTLADDGLLGERLLGVVLNKVDMAALANYVPWASNEAFYQDYGDYFSPAA
jgi:succinoglycan biosynthesis transport protein ExoP